jgi:hypothetical protein
MSRYRSSRPLSSSLGQSPLREPASAYGTVGQDFTRIPVFAAGPAGPIPGDVRATRSALPQREASVEMPGEEEQTADAGTGGGSAASAGGGSAASAGGDCVPRQVAIKNVQSFRRGKLYGHSYDVAITVDYFTPPAGRSGQDAQLIWREKTDRPPSWYGVAPNTWNDMFTLFPGSPTFAGWTKNRTKPCPGSEVATITDPPVARVDLPARTMEFDIYVRGMQVSHNARARQVLEPDGKGGVKTQTFTVLPSHLGPAAL